MRALVAGFAVVVASGEIACAPARSPTFSRDVTLRTTDGGSLPLSVALHAHPLTVVTFFSAHCPCQRAHDARLRQLMETYGPRDVGFLVVDSERTSTLARDAEEARLRSYPIVKDDDGKLALSLDAEYATYSVILNTRGDIVYRGGFDSDKSHLRPSPTHYLADALDDALAGRPVQRPEAKTLGCTLEIR